MVEMQHRTINKREIMKRSFFICIAAAFALVLAIPQLAMADNSGPSVSLELTTQASTTTSSSSATIPTGVYLISNSSKMLDVRDGSTDSGAATQLYTDNSTPAQRWRIVSVGGGYYKILNVGSGKALEVRNGIAKRGTIVQQYAWNGSKAQKWRFVQHKNGTYRIVSALSNKLSLDVAGASTANGATVQVWKNNKSKAQKWKLTKVTKTVKNGWYRIKNVGSGKVLDVAGGSTANGANVQQYKKNSSLAQAFYLTYNTKTGYYTIKNALSGKMVEVAGASIYNGANVQQYKSNNTRAQKWSITKNSNGTLTIRSALNGRALDVSNGSTDNGANVQVWDKNGSKAQKWKVSRTSNIAYETLSYTLDQLTDWNWYGDPDYRQHVSSRDELRAYLDPKNGSMYKFIDLRKTTNTTAAQLDAYINQHPYDGTNKLLGLGSTFLAAAKKYGISQDYLLIHAINETGWGRSTLAAGYEYEGGWIDGEYYPAGTYYNFHGIGAYDSSPLSGGRKMAIINGWNSREKAVYGAAEWISKNYFNRAQYPQYTLYAMKWDYLRSESEWTIGWHQFCTTAEWPDYISGLLETMYTKFNTNPTLTYVMPKFK